MWGWTRSTGQGLTPGHDTLLVPLQPAGINNAIFLVSGGLAQRPDLEEAEFLPFIELIHALGGDQPIYGLRRLGLGSILKSYGSVERLAVRYVDEVLSLQPHGPHLFVGHCLGGIFAYEIARQLSIQSSRVALVLLDTTFPDRAYKHHITTYLHVYEKARARNAAIASKVQNNWNQLVAMDRDIVGKVTYIMQKILSFSRYWMSGERKAWEIHAQEQMLLLDLIINYEPRPYDSKLLLVVTDEMYEPGIEYAWERVAIDAWEKVSVNGLEIHRIPGRHDSFLHESVRLVSDIIKEFAKVNETSSQADRNGSP
jgi:thioesterase domain-containing protein